MRKSIPLLIILLLGIIGCGYQRGRLVTTGDTSNSFLSPIGSIDIIDGYGYGLVDEAGNLNEQHLLYLVIITPCVQEHGSSSSSDFGLYVTTLSHSWITEKGAFTVSIPWDRQTDTVKIGKQEFTRGKGDVFVVRLNANGEATGQQLASLGPHVNYREVLQYIHQQLPNDEAIASIKFNK